MFADVHIFSKGQIDSINLTYYYHRLIIHCPENIVRLKRCFLFTNDLLTVIEERYCSPLLVRSYIEMLLTQIATQVGGFLCLQSDCGK
jgi:hypothetical protein